MNYRSAGLVMLLLAVPRILAEKPHPWETGVVVSQNLGSQAAGVYGAPMGNATIAAPIYLKTNILVVETQQYQYRLQEFTRSPNFHHFLVLVVNDDVRFYRDGSWFIVLDNDNKKHKFTLIGAIKKK